MRMRKLSAMSTYDNNISGEKDEKNRTVGYEIHHTVLTCTLSTEVMYLPIASRCSRYSRSSIGNDF